jgi:acetyltransferase-like isoleucine patch superfamily enzyme
LKALPAVRQAVTGETATEDHDADGAGRSATATETDTSRHDRLRTHPTEDGFNSLWNWPTAKHPLRIVVNVAIIWIVRYAPSLRLKNWLLRRLGAEIGPRVSFALTATPDVFWPELLTVEADAIVGYDATLLCHEYLQDEFRTGPVVVGERAMIGAGAVVLPGVRIGADARVGANAVVTADVPPDTTVVGNPAEPVEE